MDVGFRTVTEGYEVSDPVDIGNGVVIEFERADGVITGLSWDHGCTQPGKHPISFDVPGNEHVPARVRWTVESLDPLTLSPSLLCRWCAKHGFIRNGRWVEC
jgi:hypothetical protein